MNIQKVLLAIGLLCSASYAVAEEVTSNKVIISHFAYALPVHDAAPGKLYQFDIPDLVYQNVFTPELSDVRMFNSKNEMLASEMQNPLQYYGGSQVATVDLPIFPLYGIQESLNNLNIAVQRSGDGSIISVNNPSSQKQTQVKAWLIDARRVYQKSLKQLTFNWVMTEPNWISNVRISGSDDLSNWTTVLDKGTLANLKYNAKQFERKDILLSYGNYKYFMLQWDNKALDLRFANVVANYYQERVMPLIRRDFTPKNVDLDHGVAEFDLHGYYPIVDINFSFPNDSYAGRVELSCRNNEKMHWLSVTDAAIYRLMPDNQIITNLPMSINRSCRYWRASVSPSDLLQAHKMKLSIGWSPQKLIFLANGKEPYQLAFGSSKIMDLNFGDLSNSAFNKKELPTAHLKVSELKVISGEKAYHESRKPFTVKTAILWLLLCGGVALVGYMAMSLLKQAKQMPDPHD